MRKKSLASFLFLLCSSALWAEDAPDSQWRISVLASEISTGNSQWWDDGSDAGAGVGVAYVPNAQWDVEFMASTKSHVSPYTHFVLFGGSPTVPTQVVPVTEFRRYRVVPIEVAATRHFLTDSAIAPYVRAGVRYVAAPDDPSPSAVIGYNPYPSPPFPQVAPYIPVTQGYQLSDRTSAQIGAGARIRLTPRTAIRAEVDRLIRDDESDFDPLTRFAVGLSWMF